MTPALQYAWRTVIPLVAVEEERPDGRVELRPLLVPDSKEYDRRGVRPPKEIYHLLRFFQFLSWGRSIGLPLALRLCASRSCGKLFVDQSRGQKARFCSSACRGRTFRERAEEQEESAE